MTQDPFYDSQSAAYAEVQPAKKSRTGLIILIVVAVLLLCCCAVIAAGWFFGDPVLEMLREMGIDIFLPVLF
ncbi:MAG: hypothetical protein MUF84_03420 [Anaerolineae bacterium]|jgi:hypothetical protein|nr:hypothetical protein [Anaerolineae bacterium]